MSVPVYHLMLLHQDGTSERARASTTQGRPLAVSKEGRVYVLEKRPPEDVDLLTLYFEVPVVQVLAEP